LDNLNFIPLSLSRKQEQKKVKLYKTVVLALWSVCLILYIVYIFNYYKNKTSDVNTHKSLMEDNSASIGLSINKRYGAINTLNKFIINVDHNLNYSSATIEDKSIDLELIVDNMVQYYEIIDLIENKFGYKILQLTSPVKYNESFKFKILIEVS
jgi:hypothetical protein